MREEEETLENHTAQGSENRQNDAGGLVLAAEILPDGLPIIPVRPRPAFPGILVPMSISGRERVAAFARAMKTPSQALGLLLVRDPEGEDTPENLHRFGVVGRVLKVAQADEESANFLLNCMERFSVRDLMPTDQGLFAEVRYHHAAEMSVNPELKAYSMAIIGTLKELVQINPLYSEEIKLFLNRSSMDDPGPPGRFCRQPDQFRRAGTAENSRDAGSAQAHRPGARPAEERTGSLAPADEDQ